MQRGEGSLWVKINAQHTISAQGKPLGEMGRGCCFSGPALEIHHADDLKMITLSSSGNVIARLASGFFKEHTQRLDILRRVKTTVAGGQLGRRPFAIQVEFAKIGIVYAEQRRSLTRGEFAHGLLGIGWKQALTLRMQLVRQPFRMLADHRVEILMHKGIIHLPSRFRDIASLACSRKLTFFASFP